MLWSFLMCFCPHENLHVLLKKRDLILLSFISISSVSSVAQSSLTLWDPMNHSMPGLPVHHQLLEFTQIHVHRVGDAIQPSHPLSSPSPPAPSPSQHKGLFQWVNSSREVAKVSIILCIPKVTGFHNFFIHLRNVPTAFANKKGIKINK